MKHVKLNAILFPLLLCLGCGSITNPFEKKKEAKTTPQETVEVLSEQDASSQIASVLVESTDGEPELGAFLTAGQGESQNLQLVDVQNPDTPFNVGSAIEGVVRRAIIHKQILFILDGAHTISAYSVADRANPRKIADVELPVNREVIYDFTYIKETDRLYFSTELSGLQTAKVNLNRNLWSSEKVALPSSLRGPYSFVSHVGENLVLSDLQSEKVFFIELKKETRGEIAADYSSGGRIYRLKGFQDHLFICDVETGLHKLDTTNFSEPKLLFHLKPDGIVRDVIETQEHILVAADSPMRDLGIEVYRKVGENDYQPFKRFVTTGVTTSMQLIGGLIYAIDNREGKTTLMIMRLNL